MLKRYWHGLPWDGCGWDGFNKSSATIPDTGDARLMADLRRWAANGWRQGKPPLLRPGLWLADRLLWPLAALTQSLAFARSMPATNAGQLYRDCLITGANPVEAHLWRRLYDTRHPLPARIAGLLMLRLGNSVGHRLLADKLATAQHLAKTDVVFPALHVLCHRDAAPAFPAAALPESGLFVKPRHGFGGRGSFALTRTGDNWLVDQTPMADADLFARLTQLAQQDDLLVQERLLAAPDLADLVVDGRAPVLRLVTARLPGMAPFLHSAVFSLGIPGRAPHRFLDGTLYAPVDPATGRLAAGLVLAEPENRISRLGWNAAPLAGRTLPGFAEAVALALRAMAALPPLPLVHWDVILTGRGPVMLEGNSSGNWIIACLPGRYGLDAGPLPALLGRWMQVAT